MRKATRATTAVIAAMGLAPLGGCSLFGSDEPTIAVDRTFRGPPMGLTATDHVHVVTAQAPNPGWRLEFDRAEEAPGPTRALVTLRRPDPRLIYTQQIANLSAATTIDIEEPIEVFARIAEHDDRSPDAAYERVLIGIGPE
ncbi:MAG: hypothetical protein RIB60_01990 [Phycisphaerales bacterium]